MQTACMNPRLEVANLLEGSSDRPADVMWGNICGDVCVTHPLQPKFLVETGKRKLKEFGTAQERYGVEVKLRKYSVRCAKAGLEIQPLVASSFGAWGSHGRELLKVIGSRIAARTGVAPATCTAQLQQRLSIIILRSNARAILARANRHAKDIFEDALPDNPTTDYEDPPDAPCEAFLPAPPARKSTDTTTTTTTTSTTQSATQPTTTTARASTVAVKDVAS
jgi:hypothetical protein